jgi:hypothetical protein
MPFTRFYADCIGNGTPIPWSDLLWEYKKYIWRNIDGF